MHFLFDFLGFLVRSVIKLALFIGATLLVFGILFAGLTFALLALVWALLRGRKPSTHATFTRFRQSAQHFQQGNWSRRHTHSKDSQTDVVDVQAREVPKALGDKR